jgi:hypothetical protein
MATVAEAVQAISEATGVARVTVDRAALMLRLGPGDLWPTGKRGGGGGAAHVRQHHVVNLLIAAMVADPLNDAPETVRQVRDLEPECSITITQIQAGPTTTTVSTWHSARLPKQNGLEEDPLVADLFGMGKTLGEMLDVMVVGFCHPPFRDLLQTHIEHFLLWRSKRSAKIVIARPTGRTELIYSPPSGALLDLMGVPESNEEQPAAPIEGIQRISGKIFAVMADLVLDTLRVQGKLPSETMTPATGATGPASVDTKTKVTKVTKVPKVKVSQPGANPVVSAEHNSQQDSDAYKSGQSPLPSASHGSPSSDHPYQRRDVSSWPSSNSPRRSAG